MKGLIASALLGILLAAPVAAQIAGSGQRTESDERWYPVRKPAPEPVSSPRAVPTLQGAPAGADRGSPLVKLDVRAAKRLGRTSGVRIISGSRVTVVQPGARIVPAALAAPSRRSPMKLIRIGAGPGLTYTRYGARLDDRRDEPPPRPPTIRINP